MSGKRKPVYERERFRGEDSKCEHLWCLHCERAYPYGEYRQVGRYQMCPYEGCRGDAVLDAWDWDNIWVNHLEEYPRVPERGEVYPMY